jgi:hypothetical protein
MCITTIPNGRRSMAGVAGFGRNIWEKWRILSRRFRAVVRRRSSAWVATVFAIRPLRVESVAWVAECKDVLSGLFFMLTLGFYARYAERPESWGRYLLVVVSFALGLTAYHLYMTFDVFGPKASHAVAKSVMRRSPTHSGCGPGGASVARLL